MTPQEREQARQAAWTEYRPVLAKRHADFKRQCEDEGRGYIAPDPLPLDAPDWFKTDSGVPDEVPGEWRPESTDIKGPEGLDWLGRVVRQPPGEVPFGGTTPHHKRSVADRVKDLARRQSG